MQPKRDWRALNSQSMRLRRLLNGTLKKMTIQALEQLNTHVLFCVLLISFGLGFIIQRTHFCTMGSIADVFLMQDWTRAMQWVVATCVTLIGFGFLCLSGQIDPFKTLYFSNKWYWASTSVGGFMFGCGMVLSSGCGLKTLVRSGSGNLKSWVVTLVMALFAFMTLKGILGVLRVSTLDLLSLQIAGGSNLPNLLGLHTAFSFGAVGVLVGAVLLVSAFLKTVTRQRQVISTGVKVGLLFILMWWVSGHLSFVAEHPDTLGEVFLASKSNSAEAFSFVGPVAYLFNWLEFYSDNSNVLTNGVTSVFGVLLGSLVSSLLNATFRWEGFSKTEDLAAHLFGGALMGVGGVTAMGCSVGQGISGMSTLSLNAFSAVIFIVLGAWLCLEYQSLRLNKSTLDNLGK